jgi:hypothetical protein
VSAALTVIASAAVVLGFITALLGLSARRRIQEVHVLVNSQLSDVLARVVQLTAALDAGGVDVPPASPPATGGEAGERPG